MIVGLDLSLTGTGIASAIPFGEPFVRTLDPRTRRGYERISFIRDSVLQATKESSLVVIEDLSFGSNDPSAQERAGLSYLIRYALWRQNVGFVMVAPTSLKKFVTSSGAAKKENMILEVFKRWGFSAKDNNQADAYGLMRIGMVLQGEAEAENKAQQEVIAKIGNPVFRSLPPSE